MNDEFNFPSPLGLQTINNYCKVNLNMIPNTSVSVGYLSNKYNYTIDKAQNTFLQNTFSMNFYTGGKAMINLEGMPRVQFIRNNYSYNGESTDDILRYLTNIGMSSDLSSLASTQYGGTILCLYGLDGICHADNTKLGLSLIKTSRTVDMLIDSDYFV